MDVNCLQIKIGKILCRKGFPNFKKVNRRQVSRMYKMFCEKCGHNNYSSSRSDKLICCYCGEALKKISGKTKNDDDDNLEKLA